MTDSPDTLTPAQSRSVDLAMRAGRYRNERDALRNVLDEVQRDRTAWRNRAEQLRRILGDLLANLDGLDPHHEHTSPAQCDDLGSCRCSVARSWRVINGLPEVIS